MRGKACAIECRSYGGPPPCARPSTCSPPDGGNERAPVGDYDGAVEGAAAGGVELPNVGGGEPARRKRVPGGAPEQNESEGVQSGSVPLGGLSTFVEVTVRTDFRLEAADSPQAMVRR